MAEQNATRGDTTWSGSVTISKKTGTKITVPTKDKYVDRNLEFSMDVSAGAVKVSGGGLNHGNIVGDGGNATYLTGTNTGYPIKFSNTASRSAVTYNSTTSSEGWVTSSDFTGLNATDSTKNLTQYIKAGSAAVTANQSITTDPTITASGGDITASYTGSKSITGSVSTAGWITSVGSNSVSTNGSTTVAATTLDTNLTAANIVKGKTIFGVTGDGSANPTVSFNNEASKDGSGIAKSYTDISESTPALVENGYLYVNEGYTENVKISLAKLVPDSAGVGTDTESPLIYKSVTAYNNDGKLISGTMQDASVTSGIIGTISQSVAASAQTTGTNAGKFAVTNTYSVTAPTVGSGGYITSDKGTKNGRTGQTVTTYLNAGAYTVAGGGLTDGGGSCELEVNGLYNDTTGVVSTTDKIDLKPLGTAGGQFYKIGFKGAGTINRGAITSKNDTAGWIPAQTSATTKSSATSLKSGYGRDAYLIAKSTYSSTDEPLPDNAAATSISVTPAKTAKTVNIAAGYHPSKRTITVSAIDPTDANQVTQGVISANESSIASVTASKGTATTDTTNWKYNIPLTLSASGTAHAKVTTNGYVTTSKDTSKSLTGSGSATVSLNLYSGAFTVS